MAGTNSPSENVKSDCLSFMRPLYALKLSRVAWRHICFVESLVILAYNMLIHLEETLLLFGARDCLVVLAILSST